MPTVLVTGANSGIGRALVIAFASRGYSVAAAMRNIAAGQSAFDSVAGDIRPVELDVTNKDSIAAAFADVRKKHGCIDVLVNNAGISSNAPLEVLSEEHHRLTFETNYWGAVRLMQAALPEMRARRRGLIINISSMMRHLALPGVTPYAASKAALEMASEVAAVEGAAFGIRVVVVEPGAVVSRLQTNTAESGRWLAPDETPYAPVFANARTVQKSLLADALDADAAAEIIVDATLVSEPPFRLLVGRDAQTLVSARQRMSDEAWIALWSLPEAAYREAVAKNLRLELPT